jgi:hypothetical protein
MRILADQDVWKETVDLLRAWGHDVNYQHPLNFFKHEV